MHGIILYLGLASYGLLCAAARDDDSYTTTGSSSDALGETGITKLIYRSNDTRADYVAAASRAVPRARFNTQSVPLIFLDHERSSILAVVDDGIGIIEDKMRRKEQNMSTGASIWHDMRQAIVDVAAPTTHAALLVANKTYLSLYIKGDASKILIVWPDSIMELLAPIERGDEFVTVALDSGMQGVLLLRNVTQSKQEIKDRLAKDQSARDVVNLLMEPHLSENKAVAYFDCVSWLASIANTQQSTGTAPTKRTSKGFWRKLLRR